MWWKTRDFLWFALTLKWKIQGNFCSFIERKCFVQNASSLFCDDVFAVFLGNKLCIYVCVCVFLWNKTDTVGIVRRTMVPSRTKAGLCNKVSFWLYIFLHVCVCVTTDSPFDNCIVYFASYFSHSDLLCGK